jgi:hypothetical protein
MHMNIGEVAAELGLHRVEDVFYSWWMACFEAAFLQAVRLCAHTAVPHLPVSCPPQLPSLQNAANYLPHLSGGKPVV